MKKSIITMFLSANLVCAFGQEINNYSNELTAKVGVAGGVWKDLAFSPLVYHLSSLSLELNYKRVTKSAHLFQITGSSCFGNLTTDLSNRFSSDLIRFQLESEYAFSLWGRGGHQTYLGPAVNFNYTNVQWTDDFDLSSATTFMSSIEVGAVAKHHFELNKWRFSAGLVLPIVSAVSRPTYSGYVPNDDLVKTQILNGTGRLIPFYEYFNPEITVDVHYQLSKRISALFEYSFEYQRFMSDREFASRNSKFSTGFILKF